MKSTGVLFGLFLITSTVSAQSFLTDYFNGNIDSLIVGATQLIHFPEPTFQSDGNPGPPDPQSLVEVGLEQVYIAENHYFTARDNKQIYAYYFPNPSPDTIVLLHGVAGSAYLYKKTAVLLREATGAEVYAIDLRGHGRSEGNIGDVSYINQYVDDLADIISTIRKEKPDGKIIIAGHSMGGGIALRYAMEIKPEDPDGFLLFAPLIGHNMPAIAQKRTDNPGDEVFSAEGIRKIVAAYSRAEIGIIEGATHNGVRHNETSFILINKWFLKL